MRECVPRLRLRFKGAQSEFGRTERKGNNLEGDEFDVEEGEDDGPSERKRPRKEGNKARMPRAARNKKFGFGPPKPGRRPKENNRKSLDAAFSSSSGSRTKGRPSSKGGAKKNRPGKSRRQAARR